MKVDRANWHSGERGLAFGRALFDRVPPRERPAWASAVLGVAMDQVIPIREVEDLVRIAEAQRRWGEAHAQFSRLRTLTLATEHVSNAHPMYKALLQLAETVAKVTYNASGQPAPFDYDAGWRLASDARRLAELSEDRAFEERVWLALSGPVSMPAI